MFGYQGVYFMGFNDTCILELFDGLRRDIAVEDFSSIKVHEITWIFRKRPQGLVHGLRTPYEAVQSSSGFGETQDKPSNQRPEYR